MSVSKWAYDPMKCDGDICVGDCDMCDKPKNMEDEPTDYIKREDALRAFNGCYSTVDADDILRHLHKSIDVIKNIPSADVIEVVHCRYCIYYHPDKEDSDKPICCEHIDDVMPNDYCSYGERADK